ncbi:alpha/beta-hydrolase [Cutaneotrichosporon oleaginosum]|uniref:Carboxylic ester hydrolase n=1 Tax=Cutaneotrichosporon oleaginosum TaxID=879819 RepID=A0A0J1B841_9TREE|nr:alpha/beta-hydrolase [Cutaneotrichosporon oleaginosum]KLT43934.1 alpha/beta-hydrolase [Cutaneotrichosporon oleaginosum]TXT04119.1 hypothetical protein COLE_07816 [Cutaneotrichosporon oleaginosum]
MRIFLPLLAVGALAAPTRRGGAFKRLNFGILTAVDDTANATDTTIFPTAPLAAGVNVTGFNVPDCEAFLGIPYAEPPTGERRFQRPAPANYSRNFAAILPPPGCLQAPNPKRQFTYGAGGFSEDCLYLNVLAPDGSAGSNASLPVMVWIHGGAFIEGDGVTYVSPFLVRRAIEIGRPIVLVTINYRLGLLGFGVGPDFAAHNASNLGLHDQLAALRWVKDNIGGFGGDPTKVTVVGQSAGAISIGHHYLNASQDLFRGAILMSGAQSSAPVAPTSELWEGPYNTTAIAAGCMEPNTTALGNLTTFECMRAVPADTLVNATAVMRDRQPFGGFVFLPTIDGELIPESPWNMLKDGRFNTKIPHISGATLDEGTWTTPTFVNSTEQLKVLLRQSSPFPASPEIIDRIVERYPDIPEKGSPFGTGNETFGFSSANKQGAAIVGDMSFHSRRRKFLHRSNDYGNNQTWTYEFRGPTPGIPPHVGVPHSADVPYIFGVATQENNYTAEAEAMGTQMMDYWCVEAGPANVRINFVHYLTPNGPTPAPQKRQDASSLPFWPVHEMGAKDSMRFDPANLTIVPDTFRADQMSVFDEADVAAALLYKRDLK